MKELVCINLFYLNTSFWTYFHYKPMTLPHMLDVCLRIIQHLTVNGGVNYGLRKKQWIFFRSIGGSFHFVDYCRSCFSLLSKIIIRKRKPLPRTPRARKSALIYFKNRLMSSNWTSCLLKVYILIRRENKKER